MKNAISLLHYFNAKKVPNLSQISHIKLNRHGFFEFSNIDSSFPVNIKSSTYKLTIRILPPAPVMRNKVCSQEHAYVSKPSFRKYDSIRLYRAHGACFSP